MVASFPRPPAARETEPEEGGAARGGGVRAIWVILTARARRQWQGWLLLTLLVAIGTGVVLSAVTAGRRADSAFPSYVAAHGYDAIVYPLHPLPLATLPEVTEAVAVRAPFAGHPVCSCGKQIDDSDFAVREVPPANLLQVIKLISGQLPDQANPGETLASYTMARDYGVRPGTVIRMPTPAPSQTKQEMQALAGEGPPPARFLGPVVTLRVTGIVVAENEFPSGQGPSDDLYPTAAFAAATKDIVALTFDNVRLKHGAADLAHFEATVAGKYGANVEDLDGAAAAITALDLPAGRRPVGGGRPRRADRPPRWWSRRCSPGRRPRIRLVRRPGARGPRHPVGAVRRADPAADRGYRVTGAAAGVGVATLLSPIAPVGEARLADPAPGLVFDWPVTVAGAAAAVAAVVLLGLPPAVRLRCLVPGGGRRGKALPWSGRPASPPRPPRRACPRRRSSVSGTRSAGTGGRAPPRCAPGWSARLPR